MTLHDWIKDVKSKTENGKNLVQLYLETYITEQLGLVVLEVQPLERSCDLDFQFIATNGSERYVFESEYNEFHPFSPFEKMLTLKEIRGKEGVCVLDHDFFLDRDNRQHAYFTTPLSHWLKNEHHDAELQYAIAYLTNAFEDLEGVTYREKEPNNLDSFALTLSDHIHFSKGMTNTIQCDFLHEGFTPLQLVFKSRKKEELDAELHHFTLFIKQYLAKKVQLDRHDVFPLYQYLKEKKLQPFVNTNAFFQANGHSKEGDHIFLFQPMIIGNSYDSSCHQIEIRLFYQKKNQCFILQTNYLLRLFQTELSCIEDVQQSITELFDLIEKTMPIGQ